MHEYGNDGGGKDNKVLFISLGILCVVFLGVTSFVWSSVNRQNLDLANAVSALESQIKTMKVASGEAPSSEGSGAGHDVISLQKEVQNLGSQVGQLRGDLEKALERTKAQEDNYESRIKALQEDLESRMKALRGDFESMAEEGEKVRARLREAATQSLAFQKEFLTHLESLTAAQEKHLSGEQ
jgi:predicted phage-related endonuclease